jgi:hypothetical protein
MKDVYQQRVRTQWTIVALNLGASLLNAIVFYQSTTWIGWINLPMAIFSAWVAWGAWRRIPEIHQERHDRINRILKGEFG